MIPSFRSLRVRLATWFTVSVLAVVAVFATATYLHLHEELHKKQVKLAYPDHPDWNLHGNSSREEVQDIMGELMESAAMFAIPFLGLVLLFGYFIAGKSLKPIAELNQQMAALTPATIGTRIKSSARDLEFESLTEHLNDLLVRLARSFDDIREYAATIAHELRTPLTILRLKVEQANQQIAPELQEELQDELHRLTQMIDQSLLIARSERGTLSWTTHEVDCSALVEDLVEDFRLLARESDRPLQAEIMTGCIVQTDRVHLKQILHDLMSNALKHGKGPISVRLCPRRRGKTIHFLIMNRVPAPRETSRQLQGLGLGLRVIRALISLQSGIKFQHHHGRRYYAARLIIPFKHSL